MRAPACLVAAGLVAACGPGAPGGEGGSAAVSRPDLVSAASPVSPDELSTLEVLAHDAYLASDYDSAIVLFRRVEAASRSVADPQTTARALMWIGHAHRWLGDLASARSLGEEALAIKIEEGLGEELAASYNAVGLVAWVDGRLVEAAEHFNRSIELAEEFGQRRAAAAASSNLGLVYTELGDLTEARSRFAEMRRVMGELRRTEANPDTLVRLARAEGDALTNLAMVDVRRGDLRSALTYAEAAIEIYRETDYPAGVQAAIAHLGTAYTGLGEAHLAFAALESALDQSRELGLERETASNLEMLAELYRESGDYRSTLELYEQAKQINSRLGLEIETGVDLRGEAEILVELGELEPARELTLQARTLHREVGARLEELRDVLMLASIEDSTGDEAAARRGLAEARLMAQELGGRTAGTEVVLMEAEIAARHARSAEVLRALEGVDETLWQGVYGVEWQVELMRSQAQAALGQLDSAAASARRALSVVEYVRGSLGSGALRSSFGARKAELYSHLTSVLLRLDRAEEAFEVADAARGRALLEHFVAGTERPDRSTARVAAAEELLREIGRIAEELAYFEQIPPDERWASDADRIALLRDRLEEKRRSYEVLVVQLNATVPSTMALLGGLGVEAGQIRDALAPGELLVEYMLTEDQRAIAFAVSSSGVTVAQTGIARRNLESRVRLARDLIGTSPANHTDESASEALKLVLEGLFEVLLVPLLSTGALDRVEHLIVVPHQVLTYLPFGALRDPSTGRYLVEDYDLSLLPSAATLPALRGREPSALGAGVSVSAFAPFPDELPGTALEIRAIAPSATQHHIGPAATEARVRAALERQGSVHLATHGVMNARNPMFSRIELARSEGDEPTDDGRLEVHEVLELDVNASLVFLSGCETGVGAAHSTAFVRGEDYATLAQAFLFSGAGNVVATLWPVEDEGAKELAERFYRSTARGAVAALARAQREMIADSRYGAPYHWAAYQISGADPS